MKSSGSIFFSLVVAMAAMMLVSCGHGSAPSAASGDSVTLKYARLLHLRHASGYDVVTIDDPWNSGKTLHTYILVGHDSKTQPAASGNATILRVPLKRAAVFTSPHCGLLDMLGQLNAVKGVGDAKYVLNPHVRALVSSGKAADLGSAMQPDFERIITAHPDALLVSPFQGSTGFDKAAQAGIAVIDCADYMEMSALARAEWMKFYGMLFGCEQKADSLFNIVERNYNSIKRAALDARERPSLICDIMQSGVWYAPGGQSTLGQLFKDAGSRYTWGDNNDKGSVRLSFEKAFASAKDADVWLIRSGNEALLSYSALAKDNAAYSQLKPWKERRIYACNIAKMPFFDEEPFRPDFMLADVAAILHPETFKGHEAHYFTPLRP